MHCIVFCVLSDDWWWYSFPNPTYGYWLHVCFLFACMFCCPFLILCTKMDTDLEQQGRLWRVSRRKRCLTLSLSWGRCVMSLTQLLPHSGLMTSWFKYYVFSCGEKTFLVCIGSFWYHFWEELELAVQILWRDITAPEWDKIIMWWWVLVWWETVSAGGGWREEEGDGGGSKKQQGRRKPAYTGGLVLEPKKGDCSFFTFLTCFVWCWNPRKVIVLSFFTFLTSLSLMLELEKVNTPFFTQVFHLSFWCWNSSFCFHVLAVCSSPWYNRPGWLCIKNQVTYSR